MNNKPIGIFDSGVGGLSIYLVLKKTLPNETFIYLADQKNCPYGQKTKKEIRKFSAKNTRFLLKKDCKLIIIACNTATVAAIDFLRRQFPLINFIGTVPAVKPAAEISQTGCLAILSTKSTQVSRYLKRLIREFAPQKKVYNLSCPGLAELIEKGAVKNKKINNLLKRCLRPALRNKNIDVLAVGCSHYSFIKQAILKLFPQKIKFIQPAKAVARQVKKVLKEKNLFTQMEDTADIFYTTQDPRFFASVFYQLTGFKIKAKKVKL